MAALTLFPLQFKRQDAVPVDIDQVFDNTADRLSYLSSPRRYAGQIVTDLETEGLYFLNAAKTAWITIISGKVPYDLQFTLYGTLLPNTVVGLQACARELVFEDDFVSSIAACLTAPATGTSVFTLELQGTGVIATITFNTNATVGTWVAATPGTPVTAPKGSLLLLRTAASGFDNTIKNLSLVAVAAGTI